MRKSQYFDYDENIYSIGILFCRTIIHFFYGARSNEITFNNYKMKNFLITLLVLSLTSAKSQSVNNTSYTSETGEKVLRLEVIVPVGKEEAWQLFTKDEQLMRWMAPQAHIELKPEGYILTNYDKTKPLTDSSSIKLNILNYVQGELMTLKVNLNDNFSKSVQKEDENLLEVIQFESIGPKETMIISSMIGWGEGEDWNKTYDFFVKGNQWTYEQLIKLY